MQQLPFFSETPLRAFGVAALAYVWMLTVAHYTDSWREVCIPRPRSQDMFKAHTPPPNPVEGVFFSNPSPPTDIPLNKIDTKLTTGSWPPTHLLLLVLLVI